jgi:hypothetical protein
MKDLISIYRSDVDHLENDFSKLISTLKERSKINKNQLGLFDPLDECERKFELENLRLQELAAKFQNIINTKNKLLKIKNEYQNVITQINFTDQLNNAAQSKNLKDEIINPYKFIFDNEIRELESLRNKLEAPLIIIQIPGYDDVIFQLSSNEKKYSAASYICEIIKELNEDNVILNTEAFFESDGLSIIKELRIPLDEVIKNTNDQLTLEKDDEILQEYWYIKYKVVFEISNLKLLIKQEEINQEILQYNIIKENSIEVILESDASLTGHDIDPRHTSLKEKLKSEVMRELFDWSFAEDENLMQLLDLTNGEPYVEIIDFEFPDSNQLSSLD